MARHTVPRQWKNGMLEVGPKVFAYIQSSGIDPAGDTGIANSGLIVGHGGAVVDALMVPSMTRRLVAAIKKATRTPVASLINTHHHLDHTGGNTFFRRATLISTRTCREALAPGFPPLPMLQRFMPRFAEEFPRLKVVLPTVTFEGRMVLHDGDREIQLWHPGFPAHTVGDAVAYLPKERILFAGDLAFHYVTPLGFQGHIGNWIKAADRLLGFDADLIVPGHGPLGTKKDLKHMRDYLALVRREARKRFDAGMSPEEAAQDLRLGVYAAWSDAERVLPNVMRCYQEFRNETRLPMDLPRMLEGMERLRRGRGRLTPLGGVRLVAPVPRPASIRDFMVFEAHVLGSMRTLARMRGQPPVAARVPAEWYRIPAYYKGNPASVVGPDADVVWPAYSQLLDYELEFGLFIGLGGRDIPRERAAAHIREFTIFNDFSARDTQGEEMTLLLGPAKGKDFDTGNAIGPCLVTPDEIPDPYALAMAARVDGEEWSRGSSRDMHFRFEDLIAYVSRSETLYPGDVFGSGTVGGGCGLEHGRWLKPGATVELEVEGLGVLRNRVVKA